MSNPLNTRNPLISIIVPVYNIQEYLPRCVKALCAQTYSPIEILLVDDGSTDGTGALCDRLAEQDDRIRVFHKENGGSSSARNYGIEKAKGAYLGFVDSDDYVEADMYERLYDAICTYQVPVAQIGRDELDENGRRLPDICIPPKQPQCMDAQSFLRELLLHKGDCSFCTKLLKKELFDGKAFPAGVLNEDFHLLIQMLPQIGTLVFLPKQAYHVFCRMGSNTRKQTGFSRVFADNVDNADLVMKLTEERYPELLPAALRFGIFQRLDYMLHVPIAQMNRQNIFYKNVVSYLRKNWIKGMKSPYLTFKNKCYHTIFALAPRGARQFHFYMKRGTSIVLENTTITNQQKV